MSLWNNIVRFDRRGRRLVGFIYFGGAWRLIMQPKNGMAVDSDLNQTFVLEVDPDRMKLNRRHDLQCRSRLLLVRVWCKIERSHRVL